jgi:hypothetical protein
VTELIIERPGRGDKSPQMAKKEANNFILTGKFTLSQDLPILSPHNFISGGNHAYKIDYKSTFVSLCNKKYCYATVAVFLSINLV